MVLTPKFHFSQTIETLEVHIVLPHVRLAGMEILVVGQTDFSFYCRPYLLRVNLPGLVYGEDEEDKRKRPSAKFSSDSFVLVCTLHKVNSGEEFQGLDFITTLLAKPQTARVGGGTGRFGLGEELQGQYGFLTNFANFFGTEGFLAEFPDLVDLPSPDTTPVEMRTELKELHENAMFDLDRYRVDLHEGGMDDLYLQAMEYDAALDAVRPLTEQDNLILSQLFSASSAVAISAVPSFPTAAVMRERVFKVVDVLLAYSYELRFCTGDFSVESHVMIRKLSSCLSWLEEFKSEQQVFQSFARRCLCFPYLRRWDLCAKAAMDCAQLLGSRNAMVKALLTLRQLLQKSQSAYLLNRLFVDEMCVFAQQGEGEAFAQVSEAIVATFQRKTPGVELVKWNLLVKKTAKRRSVAAQPALPEVIPPVSVVGEERNFIEELD
ncbi:hypothetical protein BASA81_008070 [Batrachochytrium salamandrivorans]|nr:hypothetical protein BASA81_008070 [Batrachochytrium salamandrivorans]